jgi:hypothetical protein
MNPRALHAESARENATAFDWSVSPEAKVLIARYLRVDELYQMVAREVSAEVDQAFYDELDGIHAELDAIRDERIVDECDSLSEADQDDDYLIQVIEESAPSVTTVLDAARKAARDAERMAA